MPSAIPMPDLNYLVPFTRDIVLLSVGVFDKALHIQMERKDDATFALWAGVGLETITFAAVLVKAPNDAFSDCRVPSVAELQTLDYRTKIFPELANLATSLYANVSYPSSGSVFMKEVRNKLIHVGITKHVGLVGSTLRVIRDVGKWLRAVDLPSGSLPYKMDVLEMDRIDQLPGALEAATRRVADNNINHLMESLGVGSWDDTPALKEIALRELNECKEFCGMI